MLGNLIACRQVDSVLRNLIRDTFARALCAYAQLLTDVMTACDTEDAASCDTRRRIYMACHVVVSICHVVVSTCHVVASICHVICRVYMPCRRVYMPIHLSHLYAMSSLASTVRALMHVWCMCRLASTVCLHACTACVRASKWVRLDAVPVYTLTLHRRCLHTHTRCRASRCCRLVCRQRRCSVYTLKLDAVRLEAVVLRQD